MCMTTVPPKLPFGHRSIANFYLCHLMLKPSIWCVTVHSQKWKVDYLQVSNLGTSILRILNE